MLCDYPDMANITAQLIATLIQQNCDAYHRNEKTYEEWSAEQHRLWRLSERRRCEHRVKMLVAPKLLPVPRYAVRKQMREATLKVGR